MSARIAAAATVVATACAVACTVDPLDLGGKRCPCTDGFVCDENIDLCVPASEPGVAAFDAGAGDAPAPDASGRIVVFELRPTWQTGNGLRWDWLALGDEAQFDHYEVVVGPRAEAVRARSSETRVFDASRNAELGRFGGRNANPTERPVKLWTVTDGHKEGETVFAQVIAYDKAGGSVASDVASSTTTRPRGTLVVYDNTAPNGGAFEPSTTKTSTSKTFEGAQCIEHTVDCGTVASCEKDVGVLSIEGTVAGGIDSTDFFTAYVELAVRGATAGGSPFDVVLVLGADSCGAPCRMRDASYFFLPDAGEWRLLQIPLRFFSRDDGNGANLNYAELGNRGDRINGFLLSGAWPDGAVLGIDRVRIRW